MLHFSMWLQHQSTCYKFNLIWAFLHSSWSSSWLIRGMPRSCILESRPVPRKPLPAGWESKTLEELKQYPCHVLLHSRALLHTTGRFDHLAQKIAKGWKLDFCNQSVRQDHTFRLARSLLNRDRSLEQRYPSCKSTERWHCCPVFCELKGMVVSH